MTMLKRLHSRLLVLMIVALTCIRVAAARVWTFGTAKSNGSFPSNSKHGLRLRAGTPVKSGARFRHYALEVAGNFPYVRVKPAFRRSVPVPLEIAALSTSWVAEPFDLHVVSPDFALAGVAYMPALSGGCEQFRTTGCTGCTTTGTCHSTTGCSACTLSGCSACTGTGCTGCEACTGCTQGTGCTGCTGCGGCTGCTGCGGCGGCTGCTSLG